MANARPYSPAHRYVREKTAGGGGGGGKNTNERIIR